MTKKKIGLVGSKTGENSFGSTINYIAFAERFGEVVLLMPEHEVRDDLDLLILPGGPDILSSRYGQTPGWFTGKPDIYKEHFDEVYLPKYIEAGVPIFATCRAHQSVWVHYGGKLIQHMNHETNDMTKDQYSDMHDIVFAEEFENLLEFTDKKILGVNSRHHQVCDPSFIPEELQVLAYHKPNKNYPDCHIEMYAHKTKPIVSCQWHSEDSVNPNTVSFVDRIILNLIYTKSSILNYVEVQTN